MDPPSRRSDHCVGWYCLTDAQKFGIIFSASIVAIVLAIAWLCYMGAAANAHRQRFSKALPGGRRARHNPRLPTNVAMDHLPVVQQWPGYRPQVFYHPMVYHLDPQVPRAYPYLITAPYNQGVPAVTYQGPPEQPLGAQQHIIFHPLENAERTMNEAPPSQSGLPPYPGSPVVEQAASSETEVPEEPLTWRQRLNRMFSIPLGRASTIASSEAPRRSTSHSTRASSRGRKGARRSGERTQNSNLIMRLESPARSRSPRQSTPQRNRNTIDDDDVQSMETGVATVHSDDYDLPLQSQSRQPQEPSLAEPRQLLDQRGLDAQMSSPYIKSESTVSQYPIDSAPSRSLTSLVEDPFGTRPAQTMLPMSGQTPNDRHWRILSPRSVSYQSSNMDMPNGTCAMSGGREAARSFWERR